LAIDQEANFTERPSAKGRALWDVWDELVRDTEILHWIRWRNSAVSIFRERVSCTNPEFFFPVPGRIQLGINLNRILRECDVDLFGNALANVYINPSIQTHRKPWWN
jgi:hypothetical protein